MQGCTSLDQGHVPETGSNIAAQQHENAVQAATQKAVAVLRQDQLCGASTAEDRDAIFEAVLRYVVAGHPQTTTWFAGFEYWDTSRNAGTGRIELALSDELMGRLKGLGPEVCSLSPERWSSGSVIAQERPHQMKCMLWFITMVSPNEAQTGARLVHHAGSAYYTYHLSWPDGKWTVTGAEYTGGGGDGS